MKTPKPRTSTGAILLVILVLVAVLLFMGLTIWQIYKLIRNLPPRQLPPDESTAEVQQAAGEALAEFQLQYPNEPISLVATQVTVLQIVTPFEPADVAVRIWRSTNLTDWDCVGTNRPGETWVDTNPPWPNGFYKQTVP